MNLEVNLYELQNFQFKPAVKKRISLRSIDSIELKFSYKIETKLNPLDKRIQNKS